MIEKFVIPNPSDNVTTYSTTELSYGELMAETDRYLSIRGCSDPAEIKVVKSLANKAFYKAFDIHLSPYKCFVAGLKKANVAYTTKTMAGILWNTKQQLERKFTYLAKDSRLPQDQIDRVIKDAVTSCEINFNVNHKRGWALSNGLETGSNTFFRYLKKMNDRENPHVGGHSCVI